MIRVSIAAIALALAACGGGGGGEQSQPIASASGTSPTTAPISASGIASGHAPASPVESTTAAPTASTTASTTATATAAAAPQPQAQAQAGLIAYSADVANTTLAGTQSVRNAAALADGGHAVAWLSQDASGDASLFVQRYDAQGAKSGGETRVDYTFAAQDNPAIAVLRDGSIVVAAVKSTSDAVNVNWSVVMRRFDSSGAAAGNESTIASLAETAGSRVRHYLAQPTLLALADGGVAIGWASVDEDYMGKVNALHAQRFDAQLTSVGARIDFAANGIDRNLSLKLIALPDGGFVAGRTHRFQGIPYVQYRIGGNDVGALFDAQAAMPEFNTTLAPLTDGRFALWSSGSTGGYMQLLDASGRAAGAAANIAVVPETAAGLADGGWITVVRQTQGNPNLAQRYDASGAAVGNTVEVAEGMSRPLLQASNGNALALAWTFTGAMGDSDVRTQRIEAR